MNYKEFYKEIKEELNIDIAYDHFESAPKIPFLVYVHEASTTFSADNTAYCNVKNLRLELYMEEKDIDLERNLEKTLTEKEIYYSDEGTMYIDDEKLYVHYYRIEL